MDWILEFFGRGLIGTGEARRVSDKINLHIALGGDFAGFLIVREVVAVNLIETRRIAAIEQNGDVVQLGPPVELELFQIAGLNAEERALSVGLGKLKPAR